MNNTTTQPEVMYEFPAFKIVVAYEDFLSGIRARDMSEKLAHRLKTEFAINSDLWKFDLLMGRLLREQAADAASEADMIIISAGAGTELPAHVKGWVERWSMQKRNRLSVLIALLHQEEEPPENQIPPLCHYLRQVAEKAGMDFFCKTGTGDGHRLDFEFTVGTMETQPEKTKAALEEILYQDSAGPGWSTAE